MKGTNGYLDAIGARFGITSDYGLAKKLGISKQAVSGYRNGRSTFDEETAFKVADLLASSRAEVWLDIQAERARRAQNQPLFDALSDAIRRLGGMAA